ncbi:MAG: hypothetical protein ACLFRT_13715 [Actinomycetota bacterium]
MVHINEATVDDEAHVPFGGIGASGNASGNGHQVRGQGQLGGVHIQPVGHRNRQAPPVPDVASAILRCSPDVDAVVDVLLE